MSKLISIVMPTRNPYEGLHRALSSIKNTASNFAEVEICLRIDDDDKQRLSELPKLKDEFDVKEFIGPRGEGYNNMGGFLNDLATIATGRWSWLFDDDAWVEGNWQGQLQNVPCHALEGPACIAEFYKLGHSDYSNFPTCSPPGLIMPTETIKRIDHKPPVDSQWLSIIQQMNWKVVCLCGVKYYHCGRIRG